MNFVLFDSDPSKEEALKRSLLGFLRVGLGIYEDEAFDKYGFEWSTWTESDGIQVALRTKYRSNIDWVNKMANDVYKQKDIYTRKALQKEIQEYILNKEEGILEGELQKLD